MVNPNWTLLRFPRGSSTEYADFNLEKSVKYFKYFIFFFAPWTLPNLSQYGYSLHFQLNFNLFRDRNLLQNFTSEQTLDFEITNRHIYLDIYDLWYFFD